jgi:hypothetical protein
MLTIDGFFLHQRFQQIEGHNGESDSKGKSAVQVVPSKSSYSAVMKTDLDARDKVFLGRINSTISDGLFRETLGKVELLTFLLQ